MPGKIKERDYGDATNPLPGTRFYLERRESEGFSWTLDCTVEACSLRDARDELAGLGAEVIGVSMDPPEAHEKFKAKHNLQFHLLSDPEKTVITAYGAWGPKMFGREGILRRTFLIDPDSVVQKAYGRVTPLGHGEQVVVELRRLQAAEK